MRCVVTGANGFLGSHAVRELLRRGHSVTVLLRPTANLEAVQDWLPSVRVVRGSLDDLKGLEGALAEEPAETAFHLAWSGVTGEFRNDAEQMNRNVTGSLALCELLARRGCKHWIGLGSQAEYGSYDGVLKEELPANPVTAYGKAKLGIGLQTRELCAAKGMKYAWVRLLSAYGPGDDERHMVPTVVETLLRGEKPALTKGEQLWDFLYVSDAVDALCAMGEKRAEGVFNLGSGATCTIREFVEKLRDEIDPRLPLGFGEVAYRPDQVMHLEADIGRLTAATGWKPKVGLEEGIRRTVAWHKQKAGRGKHEVAR